MQKKFSGATTETDCTDLPPFDVVLYESIHGSTHTRKFGPGARTNPDSARPMLWAWSGSNILNMVEDCPADIKMTERSSEWNCSECQSSTVCLLHEATPRILMVRFGTTALAWRYLGTCSRTEFWRKLCSESSHHPANVLMKRKYCTSNVFLVSLLARSVQIGLFWSIFCVTLSFCKNYGKKEFLFSKIVWQLQQLLGLSAARVSVSRFVTSNTEAKTRLLQYSYFWSAERAFIMIFSCFIKARIFTEKYH